MTAGTGQHAALRAEALCKLYRNNVSALTNVSVVVEAGSITALVGPNAAGKSTLIKTWVAFERPTSGRVEVLGVNPWRSRSQALMHVGYVPQQPALYRGLTVEDHLDVVTRVRPGFDGRAARAHLDDLMIPPRARSAELSGGQQAQVMLAIALGTRADVLLLDEPLANLDPLARGEFLAKVQTSVRESGGTALLSSHIISDIAQVCNRLVVLGLGTVLLDDSIAGAISEHRTMNGNAACCDGAVSVGTYRDSASIVRRLVRLDSARPDDVVTDERGLSTATLDDIVKGYLAAGRGIRHADT